MKFYSYFDGKTQFSQIFLGLYNFLCLFIYLFWGGGGGQITVSFTCVLYNLHENVGNWSDRNILASCVFADVSKGWRILGPNKHGLVTYIQVNVYWK